MPSTVVLASRYGLPLDTPPEFVWGYADTMRMDSVRPSCMECVEKHLGAALVLMGEAEAGYPEHKLLAIGHLHEAAEESADMRPELSALLRDIRKRYQQGEAVEFEAILEALNQHGVWRMDQLWKAQEAKNTRADAFLQGYLEVMSWRFDRKGEGVACGRGWISRRKKCGRDKSRITSPEAKARTVEKQKVRQQLRGQVKAAKGQKPYVKPKQDPDAPQEMPHKNPKTPQEFIENGRAVAGAFLSNAKKLDSDLVAQQQAVAEADKALNTAKFAAWNDAIQEARKILPNDSEYQKARQQQEDQSRLLDEARQQLHRYEMTSKEYNKISARKIEADLAEKQIRDRKTDDLIEQNPSVIQARKVRDEAQQKLATLSAPATKFKQQLISTSTMPRSEAEARAKKVKKPPKAKDPGLSDQIADFNQLTNGAPTTLNRITITEKRAHATRDGLARYHGPGSEPTLWHEMAHHLEYADPAMAKVAEDWVKSRATGPEESLRKLTGNNRYDRSEKAYPDHFIDPYVGKVYEGGATEVLSMGLETFSSPERMIQLAAKDPDHFALVLGLTRRPE